MSDSAFSLRATSPVAEATRTGPWPAKLLLLTLLVPFFFPVGPLFLTADRIVLLLLFIPCLKIWLSGGTGRILFPDILVVLFCLWTTFSTVVVDGFGVAVEASGINLLETLGAYLVGRCFVRSAEDFLSLARFLVFLILAMLPFAIHETMTGNNFLLGMANQIWPSYADVPKEPRWGLDRVALTFYHPILFGVFCTSGLALAYFVVGHGASGLVRHARTVAVGFTAFLSLSSGPLTAMVAQLGLMFWDRTLRNFKNRWKVLVSCVASLWVALEIAANRSVPELFLTYFAFNPATAYNRIRIWEFGTLSIQQNPLFGIGISGDWERPWWMSGSMDMFWIVAAVQQGLAAGILQHMIFLSIFVSIALKPGFDERTSAYRMGFLVCLMGFYLAGWTVHYWKVVYVQFMMLLGCGGWMLLLSPASEILGDKSDQAPVVSANGRSSQAIRKSQVKPRYTRFANGKTRRSNRK